MRGKDLLECMEHIDDALVEEALEPAAFPHRTNKITKWGMAAACVVVIGISATAFWSHQNVKEDRTASPMAMDTAGSDNSADSLSEDSLTAGAVAENTQADVDDMGGSVNDISAPSDVCALPTAEEYSGAGSGSDSGDGAVSQDSAADAASGTGNTAVIDREEKLEKETAKLAYTVISDYYGEKDGSVYDYPVPEKGKFFCYHYLQETMEYYDKRGNTTESTETFVYAYDVVIDIYGDIEKEGSRGIGHSSVGSEKIEQEYMRLTELGYTVRLSEDFQLSGTFTKEELDAFQASPEYGYTFRFADEY